MEKIQGALKRKEDQNPMQGKVMIIFAHPDDAEGNCGWNPRSNGPGRERSFNTSSSRTGIREAGTLP